MSFSKLDELAQAKRSLRYMLESEPEYRAGLVGFSQAAHDFAMRVFELGIRQERERVRQLEEELGRR